MDMNPPRRARCAATVAAIILAAASRFVAAAPVEMPPRAPRAAVAQDVGLTRITVEYRSPAVRGHQIWGDRVALGEPWRAGDSPQATIELGRDVMIAGAAIPAGKYALIPTPAASTWSFTFEAVAHDGEAAKRPIRVEVPVEHADPRERLRFAFSSFTASSARLDLEWESVRVSLPITVDTNAQILSSIAELDRRDAELGRDYAQAAKYLLAKKDGAPDREKAHDYLERAAALDARVAPPPSGASIASPTIPSQSATERVAPTISKATRAPSGAEIGPVVSKGRPAIQACYQRALRRDPSLASGKVTVSIAVGTSGLVKSVEIRAPEGLRPVEACVKEAVSRWAFPPSPEAYSTELPFVLDRRD